MYPALSQALLVVVEGLVVVGAGEEEVEGEVVIEEEGGVDGGVEEVCSSVFLLLRY
jgi:hypothetical protein